MTMRSWSGRRRITWWRGTLFCGLLAACGGASPATETGSGIAETVEPAEPSSQEAQGARSGPRLSPRQRLLQYVPGTTKVVLHLSWSRFQESELFAAHRQAILSGLGAAYGDLQATCGIDPTQVIDALTIGLDDKAGNPDSYWLVLTGTLSQSDYEACEGLRGGGSMHAYWPEPGVVVFAEKSPAAIEAELRAGSLLQNQKVMAYVNRSDAGAAMWGGGILPASVAALSGGAAVPNGFFLDVYFHRGADAVLTVDFDATSDAQNMQSTMQTMIAMMQGAGPAAGLLSRAVQVEVRGADLKVDVRLTEQDLAQIFQSGLP